MCIVNWKYQSPEDYSTNEVVLKAKTRSMFETVAYLSL